MVWFDDATALDPPPSRPRKGQGDKGVAIPAGAEA